MRRWQMLPFPRSLRSWFSPLRALLLGAPLLLALMPAERLPPALAYAVGGGRWLPLAGVAVAAVSLAGAGRLAGLLARLRPAERLEALSSRSFHLAVFGAALALILAAIPGHRWAGMGLSGDEPKYLALAESVYRDLDVDVSAEGASPLTAAAFARNASALVGASLRAARALVVGVEEPLPAGHRWRLGNWAVAGRHGGRYLVQSPGLGAVLAPGIAAQRLFRPDDLAPTGPFLVLALLWALAALQTVRLAAEVSGSRGAGLAAGAAVALSAPLFVGGYHFYPEAVAAAVTPWLARYLLPAARRPSAVRAATLALGAGALAWLHPKFLLLGLAAAGLLAVKVGRSRVSLPLVVAGAGLPLLAVLLYDHHVTGLFRPDALYRRYGDDVYRGPAAFLSADMPGGLSTALFGARDGILVMAPVLVGGVLALPLLWRRRRRVLLPLGLLFASLWVAAAVHGGGAGGPPGRLMAPVATLLAAPLAVGLVELRTRPYRWTVCGLLLVTLAITTTMLGDWRRTVNPYRRMFAPATDFSSDLPDGPPVRPDVPLDARRNRNVAAGAVLTAALALWAHVLTRRPERPPEPDPWPDLVRVHLAWWTTLALLAFVLHALRPGP
jgi:hypothetical protein